MATLIKPVWGNVSRQDIRIGPRGDTPQFKGWVNVLFVVASVIFIVSGCGVLKPIDKPSNGGGSSQPGEVVTGVYHDFDDILIPKAMQVNRKMTSVFETPAISAGVLSLGGKFKLVELIEFFKTNMTKDNWTVVSMFKGPRSILQFEKGNRWCVMTLMDNRYGYKTQVEIWVTPKNEPSSGLLK
ncbi:hypothetical protein ACFL2E_13240 [Thermodesulfobacteriota bacterium]